MIINKRGVAPTPEQLKTAHDDLVYVLKEFQYKNAALNLGDIYRDGIGVETDIKLAEDYYRQAEELGSEWGLMRVAFLSIDGKEVPPTKSKDQAAFGTMKEAADKDHVAATNDLGWMYKTGLGTDVSVETALSLYLNAYDEGNAQAAENLGYMFREGSEANDVSTERAVGYFRDAIDRGDEDGAVGLTNMLFGHEVFATDNEEVVYVRPPGIETSEQDRKDDLLAKKYLVEAQLRDTRHPGILHSLGWVYQTGRGVSRKDLAQALTWYKRAAEQGSINAQLKLATWYARGFHVVKDWKKAVGYIEAASNSGSISAAHTLYDIRSGYRFKNDPRHTSEKQCADAKNVLARYYYLNDRERHRSYQSKLVRIVEIRREIEGFEWTETLSEADRCPTKKTLRADIERLISEEIGPSELLVGTSRVVSDLSMSILTGQSPQDELAVYLKRLELKLQATANMGYSEAGCLRLAVERLIRVDIKQSLAEYRTLITESPELLNSYVCHILKYAHFLSDLNYKNPDVRPAQFLSEFENIIPKIEFLADPYVNSYKVWLYGLGSKMIEDAEIKKIFFDENHSFSFGDQTDALVRFAKSSVEEKDRVLGAEQLTLSVVHANNHALDHLLTEGFMVGDTSFWRSV